jgi:hypothetical protein
MASALTSAPPRDVIFLSHATPEDNAFTRWIGAKLTALGYQIWSDITRLHGGADWSRDLEGSLRKRAIKMLVVCSPESMEKDGVRKEIIIGAKVRKDLPDPHFIIPLRLKPFEAHFEIAQSQYVDFSKSWANGLAELVELLASFTHIPRSSYRPMQPWIAAQTVGAKPVLERAEVLTSNWVRIVATPKHLHYVEPPVGFPLEQFHKREIQRMPCVPFGGGILTFESAENGLLASEMPARKINSITVGHGLGHGWKGINIDAHEFRRHFADLVNQAFDRFMKSKGLKAHENAYGGLLWWGDIKTIAPIKIVFDWPLHKGRRQITGKSDALGVHWHFGFNGAARSWPIKYIRLSAGLIFSGNGLDALDDAKRMHRLRRSFAKAWRNARWRDMVSTYLWWLSDGANHINLPVAADQAIGLRLPPVTFNSPVSVDHAKAEAPADEDPTEEDADWEDEEDDEADPEGTGAS